MPWADLAAEIEELVLPQEARIPPGSKVITQPFQERPDFLVRIVSDGAELGSVWFGVDPIRDWAWDGLIRIGRRSPTSSLPRWEVWRVLHRFSDGLYETLAAHDP